MPGSNPVPDRPRDISSLFGAAFELYARYPALFAVLAAGIILPFDAIVLAVTGAGPYSTMDESIGTQAVVGIAEWLLIAPLVSALHVHAVADVHDGEDPRIGPVAIRGFQALPVVIATVIMSTLGIALGFIALIVPGVILTFRWFVAAQAAAIEREGWLESLRKSRALTAGNYLQVLIFILALAAIAGFPGNVLALAFGDSNTVPVVAVGIFVHLFTASFSALTTALLYFDLVARRR